LGRIKPGVSDEVVCTIDLAASVAALTGIALAENSCLDSQNLLPALLGESSAKGRDHLLQQDNGGVNFGLRMGDWKLVRMKTKGKSQAKVSRKERAHENGLHGLYHLLNDPGEMKNVSDQNPNKLKEMIGKLDQVIAAGRSRK